MSRCAPFLLTACLVPFVAGNALAASFSCARGKTTPMETTICSDPTLSSLDEQMAERYAAALRAGPAADLKKSQRNWLQKERNVCKTVACIEAAYRKRIEELDPARYPAPAK